MFRECGMNETQSEGKEKSQVMQSMENSVRYHESSEQKEYSFNPVHEEMDVEIINDHEAQAAQQISASLKPGRTVQESVGVQSNGQSYLQSNMQFSNIYNASLNESSQKTQEILNSQRMNSYDANNSLWLGKPALENSLTEENYNQYMDINRPPRYTRNMILCSKVQAMIKDKDTHQHSEIESIRIEKEPIMEIKEISNLQTEMSLIEEFVPSAAPKIVNYQKPLKIYLRVSQNKDCKILYQNDWYSFDLYLNLEKKDTRKKTPLKTKRDISPIAPDSIVRQVYQEFGMVRKDKEQERVFDWGIKMIRSQISINALKRRRKENVMRFYIDLDVQHLIEFSEKQFQHLLCFLGMLLQG